MNFKYRNIEIVVFGSEGEFAVDFVESLELLGRIRWVESERCLPFVLEAVSSPLLIVNENRNCARRFAIADLRKNPAFKSLAVAICSQSFDLGAKREAFSLGADIFIQFPCLQPVTALKRLSDLIHRKKALHERRAFIPTETRRSFFNSGPTLLP